MKYVLGMATLILLLLGGSISKGVAIEKTPLETDAIIRHKMKDGSLNVAIKQLEVLDKQYPFGPCSDQVKLNLIYAYYKSGDLLLAQAFIDRFLSLNPMHSHMDYVMYMRGLVDMAMDESALHSLFGIDRSDRDLQHTRIAFSDLRQLIQRFPRSQYVADAAKRLVYLKERLARYELSVVKYYIKRGAYVAVVNRAAEMLREYRDTKATKDVLPLMEHAYKQLHLRTEAEKVAKLIAANP